MTRLLTIPFALGQDEGTTSRELPAGPLREAINVRQRRANALGVRPDYPAVSMAEYDGTLKPTQVYSLNGRLLALGDAQGLSYPTDMHEYVNQTPAAWKGTLPVGGNGLRVPSATNFRNMGQPPDGLLSIQSARIAAVNSLVCLVYSGPDAVNTVYVHIFDPRTDSTILFTSLTGRNARAVVAGNSFWVLYVKSDGTKIIGQRFDTTVDKALQATVNIYSGVAITNNLFDAVSVTAAPIVQFALVVLDGVNTSVRRYNEAGTLQTAFGGPNGAIDALTLESDTARNQTVIASRIGAADVQLLTLNQTTGAGIAGPVGAFGQAVTGDISLVRYSPGSTLCVVTSEDDTRVIRRGTFDPSGLVVSRTSFGGYNLAGRGVSGLGGVAQPLQSTGIDNQLMMLVDSTFGDGLLQPLACVDQGIAVDGATAVGMNGEACKDSTTGLYYWARMITSSDNQNIPIVAEFALASSGFRQGCQIGNELYLSGALPLMYDGRQVVESGFAEIPAFSAALTPTTGGALSPGASYDYCFIWKWVDSQGRLCQSRVSNISTVQLSSSQSAVDVPCYTPHTLRRDVNTGSTPTINVYRTVADISTTTAILVGDRDFSTVPFVGGEFNGKTLQISVDGGGTQTVTFATPANVADLIVAINAQTTGLTASLQGDSILLTDDTAGSTGSLGIVGGTTTASGLGYIGFFVAESATGTTTFVKSTVFNLAAVRPIDFGNLGDPITVSDAASDALIITQEPLYTDGAHGALSGILEREAPPPNKFCCALRQRAFIGGLPDPTEVRISYELFPAEALSFSSTPPFAAFVEGAVTGVGSLDGIPIAFTQEAIYAFSPGALPDDNGAGGQLGPPIRLPAEGGLSNAASILETSKGLFYQARDNKLMLLPLGGNNPPVWIGKKMQDTLAAFPNITGAVYVDVDNVACFTCQNVAGTASVIIVFDLLIGQWYLDTFSSAQVIKSAAPHAGLLAYIDGNTVRVQATSLVPAAFIPMNAKTGSILPFSNAGWGQLPSITVESVFRGNCKLRCRISYDDGVTFTNLKTFTYTTALGYVAGQTIVTQWWPGRRKGFSYTLDFDVLVDNGGTASEGLQLLHYSLELDGARPSRVRTSAAQRS